jgi:carboxylate-amine ligase
VSPLRLFDGFGVELEYMLVDRRSLGVLPAVDRLLEGAAGRLADEIPRGAFAWSNELVLHVVEFKTNGPAPSFAGLAEGFQTEVRAAAAIAATLGGRLMPTAMHPWMDPLAETRLWPHDHNAVYDAFDRIFGCRGHGWSNLQSTHVNLPFHGDDEFARLHAAVRVALPLVPGLAASSPAADGRRSPYLDTRLHHYQRNCARIPSITGAVVPEPVFTRAEYERDILERMYADIAPYDPAGVLRDEFLNARGAIARFSRGTIELRVIDAQECPAADIAVAEAVTRVVRALVEERWAPAAALRAVPTDALVAVLQDAVRDAEDARVTAPEVLRCFGLRAPSRLGDVWSALVARLYPTVPAPLQTILDRGTLARRIVRALDAGRPLRAVYAELCDCLEAGRVFGA